MTPRRILAIVAHPDDETLGCGGTLARLADAGWLVSVATFTDGVGSRPVGSERRDAGRRRVAFGRALAQLGVQFKIGAQANLCDLWPNASLVDRDGAGWEHGGFPDQRLDAQQFLDLTRFVDGAIARFRPEVVLTHYPYDLNRDHRLVAEAVLVSTRPATSVVRAIYGFETPSSTEWAFGFPPFVPDLFIDLGTEYVPRKVAALAIYADEVRSWPHPRSCESLRALAITRGAAAGLMYAEAFATLRRIISMSIGETL